MAEAVLSPMMQQYMEMKQRYSDCILFFRLGDFYEMFFDDAIQVSRELELTLTGRDCGMENRAPMCGVPHHSSEVYIKRLIDKGYKVAICEQTCNPADCKGLVPRDVIRVVTPGTLIENSMLDEGKNNYIATLYLSKSGCGMAFADLSTGDLHVMDRPAKGAQTAIINELARYSPAEVLFNDALFSCKEVASFLKERTCAPQMLDSSAFEADENTRMLLMRLKAGSMEELGLQDKLHAAAALSALLNYIHDTQKASVERFTKSGVNVHAEDEFLGLDFAARRNLELTETMRGKDKRGSLLWVLDKTKTSMGKRLLKRTIEQPLMSVTAILRRLDAVEQLTLHAVDLSEIADALSGVYDLERLMTRILFETATPRDVKALAFTAAKLPEIKERLAPFTVSLLRELNAGISPMEDIRALIENAIMEEPPVSIKDGGVIKDGFNAELDELRHIVKGGKGIIAEIEQQERERTGIKTLKISYNRVFGYYIEISKSYINQAPPEYIRKQTLANCERYITESLKNAENSILGANDKILTLEAEIFAEVRRYIAERLTLVQETATSVAMLDVLCSFAAVSMQNGYVKPDITLDKVITITDGRHPVVEAMLSDEPFVPNDTHLDTTDNRLLVLTGPNMAGKSTYMRQVALIVLMAQMGCFVPAKSARIGIVDKIFTRVGASDDLASGQSTFMVEMSEVADILRNATKRSLVILDEIGRGTSTFDGISIARAVAEHISAKSLGCKTLFATHYHELIELEQQLVGVKNYSVAVKRRGEDIIFLRKIVPGGVDDSYGIEVAKLAGVPTKVVERAKEILAEMERAGANNLYVHAAKERAAKSVDDTQVSFHAMRQQQIMDKLCKVELSALTPEDAHYLVEELVKLL